MGVSPGPVIELLLIACVVALLAQWVKLPYTIALVLVGLMVAVTKITPTVSISPEIIFSLVLPPLLFQGAMHMDTRKLRENWKAIGLLAIPGVVATMLGTGIVIHYLWGIGWMYAFLFGALIAPTDPVSVLATLKTVGAPDRLKTVLEGESIFNDGTGVVLFSVILGMLTEHRDLEVGKSAFEFLRVLAGSVAIGGGLGFLVSQIFRKIDDHLLEVTITVVLVFGAPITAEYLHCSGVLAVVVAGLIMGNYGRVHSMSKRTRETIETFWEVVDFILNSLIFLLIGIELQVVTGADLVHFWKPVLGGIAAVLLIRAAVVYPGIWIHNRVEKSAIPLAWSHVLFWGGLRGAIPLALVVGLPDVEHRTLFLTATFAIVLFSLVAQGLTIKPLIERAK